MSFRIYKNRSLHIFCDLHLSLHHNTHLLHLLPSAPPQHPQNFSAIPVTDPNLFLATSCVLSSLPLHIWEAWEVDSMDPLAAWTFKPYFLSKPAWMGLPSQYFAGFYYHRTEVRAVAQSSLRSSSSSASLTSPGSQLSRS